MSAIQDLSVSLEYPDLDDGSGKRKQFYSPGDFMEGVVVLGLNTSLRVRGLYLSVVGQAYTAWENQAKKKTYEDVETYIDHTEPLMDPTLYEHTFPKGYHRFAFRFPLPGDIPSTFHGTYGSVTYVARVNLEAEDEMMNTITNQPFMVLRRDPLPSQAYSPMEATKSKTYFGLEVGKIKVNVNLNHAIAVPGETILVNAEVFNWSGKDITLLEGSLVAEAKYYARGKRLVFRQYLSKRQDAFDVNLRWGRKWTDVKIQIPPHLADSGLAACRIIDVKYLFQFRVQIKGQDDIIIESPLHVGYHQDNEMTSDPKMMLMNRMLSDQQWQPTRSYRPN